MSTAIDTGEAAAWKKYVAPFGIVLAIAFILGTIFYPMARMELHDLPFAISNQDEGATTPAGTMVAGDQVVEKLTSNSDAPFSWTAVDDPAALDEALENNEYYGAVIIPANFTASQLAAKAGQGEPARLQVILDNGKNPMVANSMKAALGQQLGDSADIMVIHSLEGTESANPMGVMLMQQMGIMPLILMALICGLLLSRAGRNIWVNLGVAAGLALFIGLVMPGVLAIVTGASVPYWALVGFYAVASFSLLVFFLGAFSLHTAVGGLAALSIVPFGMALGVLPREGLTSFWQNFVYPWVPQRFLGEGLRSVLFMDSGMWATGLSALLAFGVVGLVLLGCSALRPVK